ncbi:MAG: thiamine pyrophosphate-dependent dehydrogenase E1 component subunit alpha [Gammaproteobacteria bacterium]|nr:thiamine pyrophosphate-dependent dehydrogenase E1 component subunit alpha [Gammaproteobacteria bacterium]
MSTLSAGLDALHVYRQLRVLREFEDQMHAAIARGNVPGFTHLYAGEEASAVGLCAHLRATDILCSTHRAHGHYLAKGGDLEALALEIHGKEGGCCGGKGGTMHVADWSCGMWGANSIIGASVPHALGAAFAFRYRGEDGVAVSFGGDGASNQGAGFEAMNLAKVLNLPVLFVLEDNGYAETTAAGWACAGRPVDRAAGFGIPGVEVDGTDVVDVWTKLGEGVRLARAGQGPSFFHVRVPLFHGHYEGDPETYRAPGEVKRLREEADCLKKFRARILGAGQADATALDRIDGECAARVAAALAKAQAAPFPAPATLTTDVYAKA